MLSTIECHERSKQSKFLPLIIAYKVHIGNKIENTCNDIINIINNHLLPKTTTVESEVFYTKLKIDYYRYLAECLAGDKGRDAEEKICELYKEASRKAKKLPANSLTRLGVYSSYSIFLFEVIKSTKRAHKIAKAAFEAALADFDKLEGEEYKQACFIMQLAVT
eukprot:TRINITY_DN15161_c0_g6_i1.p1 TRINITY_DN15161_c0_g6~~TRINITY_DN15161_c0_g6_i1.p1  ORF type:complete len:164 (+),score=11.30 TRINITY_DN15161_c0_g6_i1:206-697(+)